jgi:heme-degrading monooxygenase HmoA
MLRTVKTSILAGIILLLNASVNAQQTRDQQSKTEKNMKQILIDKVTVPAGSKEEFLPRMNMSREFVKKQPGFIKDEFFEQADAHGDLIYITIVVWENEEAFEKARHAVQAEYQREGFDLPGFCQRLNIKLERNGIYHYYMSN